MQKQLNILRNLRIDVCNFYTGSRLTAKLNELNEMKNVCEAVTIEKIKQICEEIENKLRIIKNGEYAYIRANEGVASAKQLKDRYNSDCETSRIKKQLKTL